MKRLFLLLVLAAAVHFAYAQADISKTPHVETTVEVTREVIPDRITVRVELSELESRGKVSLSQMEKSFGEVLEEMELDPKTDVAVESQSISSVKRSGSYNFKTYLVTVSNAADVSTFFSLLNEHGIHTAAISTTEYSKRDSLLEEIRREAVLQTRKEAESMAAAVSQTIGKALYIHSVVRVRNDEFMIRGLSKLSSMDNAPDPVADIEVKTLKFTQGVTAYYELK